MSDLGFRLGATLLKTAISAAVVLMFLAVASTSAVAASVNAPVRVSTLESGLKVIVQEDHSTDLVAIDIWVRAGSINETDETNGMSHFIEHLLFRTTEKRGPGQIDMEIESLGASAEARTSKDWAHFFTVVARGYLDKALDILSDAVSHPKFRPEDIEHERGVILDEIAERDSDPSEVLRSQVCRAVYTVHPYRLSAEGTRDSVSKITRQMIVGYYNRLYVPNNTFVILVGDVAPSDGIAAVRKAFADFAKSAPKPAAAAPDVSIPKEPARTEQARVVVKRSTRLAYLAVAFLAPSVKDRPDVYAMDLLMSHLGVGYQSWLAAELRDKQKLAVQVSSDFLTQRDPGLAVLTVVAEPAKVEKAEEAIFAKIAELRSRPLSDGELARARRSVEGGYAFDVETFTGRATTLGFYEAIDSFEFARSYIENIRKVTSEDVLALAKKYLDPDRAVVVVVGP